MDDSGRWHFDKTINIPSIITIAGVAISVTFWVASIQSQVTTLAQTQTEWKSTWAQFTAARELTIRSYEQRMTTQEQLGREILRRLDEMRDDIKQLKISK